jgi:hypothetical protein
MKRIKLTIELKKQEFNWITVALKSYVKHYPPKFKWEKEIYELLDKLWEAYKKKLEAK